MRNLVIGAEVNVGARLQQAAAPGEILAGDTTHILAGSAVEFGEMRLIAAKGFEEELPAWPVIGLTPGAIVRMARFRRAVGLLVRGELSLAELAARRLDSAASAPEKKPHSRSNNHQAGIDYRYPGNCLLAHDGTMIITDLNKNDFSEYLDRIAAETGVPLPDPEAAGYLPH